MLMISLSKFKIKLNRNSHSILVDSKPSVMLSSTVWFSCCAMINGDVWQMCG